MLTMLHIFPTTQTRKKIHCIATKKEKSPNSPSVSILVSVKVFMSEKTSSDAADDGCTNKTLQAVAAQCGTELVLCFHHCKWSLWLRCSGGLTTRALTLLQRRIETHVTCFVGKDRWSEGVFPIENKRPLMVQTHSHFHVLQYRTRRCIHAIHGRWALA